MNFLGKAFAQISDLFQSMTPGARITAGLLLTVVVVSVGYLFNRQMSGPDEYLLGGQPFSPSELSAMEAAFGKAGLEGYAVEGNKIRIPSNQKSEFLGALIDNQAMPENHGDIFKKMLADDGVFVSTKAREQRTKIAIQNALALAIRGMKDIERASVLYDVKTKPGTGLSKETVATASVSVKPVGSLRLDEERVRDIRNFVAGAIAELQPENISVSDQNGRTYPAGDSSMIGPQVSKMRDLKESDERTLKRNILQRLSYIPGVLVGVNVELDPKVKSTTRDVKLEPKSVAVEMEERTSEESKSGGGPAGRPGVAANSATAANTGASVAAQSGPTDTKSTSETSTHSQPHGSETETVEIGMTAKRVTVSVGVPNSYYEMVWRKQNNITDLEQAPAPNSIIAIESAVKTAIAEEIAAMLPVHGKDPVKQVTVKSFTDPPKIEVAEPGFGENAAAWFGQYWSTLGMTMLGLVSLLMLRSMVRSSPISTGANEQTPATAAEALRQDDDGVDEESVAGTKPARRLQRRGTDGPSLRDELSEMVREDPDAAAGVLRAWIGTGA